MEQRKLNEEALREVRVEKINRVMDSLYDNCSDIYENIIDRDSKLSIHYLNKMIKNCEVVKSKLIELLKED
jgi:hypothetical protein